MSSVALPTALRTLLTRYAPLLSGLYGFASTTFILSMYNVNARGILNPNVVVGMALFVGGLAQFVAGMWEFATANTFGATGECLTSHPPKPRPSGASHIASCLARLVLTPNLIHSFHHVRWFLDVVRDYLHPRLWCAGCVH